MAANLSPFADMTYEGARSITGPFLALFGTSRAVVGFLAGLGELISYGLRLAAGYLADRASRPGSTTVGGAWSGRWTIMGPETMRWSG